MMKNVPVRFDPLCSKLVSKELLLSSNHGRTKKKQLLNHKKRTESLTRSGWNVLLARGRTHQLPNFCFFFSLTPLRTSCSAHFHVTVIHHTMETVEQGLCRCEEIQRKNKNKNDCGCWHARATWLQPWKGKLNLTLEFWKKRNFQFGSSCPSSWERVHRKSKSLVELEYSLSFGHSFHSSFVESILDNFSEYFRNVSFAFLENEVLENFFLVLNPFQEASSYVLCFPPKKEKEEEEREKHPEKKGTK